MKTIASATVVMFSDIAEDETALVTTPDGREFIVAEIDDLDEEIEAVSQSRELMELLAERPRKRPRAAPRWRRSRLGLD